MTRPILRKMCRDIDALGGEEWMWEQIVGGRKPLDIMAQFGVTRPMFYQWLNQGGDARREAWAKAKEFAAHTLVDSAGDILDDMASADRPPDSATVRLAESRANFRKWLAGRYNRKDYGDDPTTVVNLGAVHLNVLRELGGARNLPAARPALPEPTDADYEVVE